MRKQLYLFFALAISGPVFSQADSVLFAAALQPRVHTNPGDPVYSGRQYTGYEFNVKGNQFYGSEGWQKSVIRYRDITYAGINLKYEQVKDEVLVLHPNGFTPVVLFTPRIHSFTLGDKQFVNLPETEVVPYKAGLYEVLATGPINLYAKRSMLLEESIVSNALEREFVYTYSYYVKKDGVFQSVKNEKTILQLVGDKRKEAKSLLKKAGIKFRKAPEEALLTIVNYYNQSSR